MSINKHMTFISYLLAATMALHCASKKSSEEEEEEEEEIPSTAGQTGIPLPSTTSTPVNANCPATTVDYTDMLHEAEKQTCANSGQLVDRLTGACREARLTETYPCTAEGIVTAFANKNITAKANLDDAKAKGLEIDQCGENAGLPFVTLLKKALKEDCSREITVGILPK